MESRGIKHYWKYLKAHTPRIHGARGMTMLGFALVCFGFGTAYAWPGVLAPAILHGENLALATSLLPIEIWGVLWYLVGVCLTTSAFKVEQSNAMGLATALFSVWSISQFNGSVIAATTNTPSVGWLVGLIFLGLVIACLGIARMPNPGRTHKELVNAPGEGPSGKLFGDTGELPVTTKHGDD